MNPLEKFKQLKQESGLSNAKYAEKLKVKLDDVASVMSGKQKSIRDSLAYALEQEYNIPFKYWKTGIEEEPKATDEERQEAQRIVDEWQSKLDVTDKEMQTMIDAMHADKTICMLLFSAINGDAKAMQRLKQIICAND